MAPHESPPHAFEPNAVLGRFLRPAYALPAAVIIGALALAIAVQPNTQHTSATAEIRTAAAPGAPTTHPTSTVPPPASTAVAPTEPPATAQVAGARSTPSPSPEPTIEPAVLQQPTQCGTLRESSVALNVEQAISGISIRATRAAVYPIDYFSCILVAAGGAQSLQLASAIHRQETAGMTHVVLIDLWIANSSRLFGQVNLRTATLAAAGQSFPALATLGGRSEVVIASGQGRNVTVVAAARTTVGETLGPMTLVIEAPLAAGTPVAGRYQLFLPNP